SSDFLPRSLGSLVSQSARAMHMGAHREHLLMYQSLGILACRSLFHSFHAFAGEGQQQKLAGGSLVNASRLQVEESVLFDLPDRRTVRAFHIIRIDFQLRLGVDL